MESVNVEMPAAGGTPATARWNPTKEQISMLEGLYGQGIRTPSAEQIQEITNRLKAYGHIEGKNVFYWFQNHKARQRQKQKDHQHHLLHYFNGYLHKPSLFPPPPPTTNVVCNPYSIAQRDQLGFSSNYRNLPVPGGIEKRPRLRKVSPVHEPAGAVSSVLQHMGDNSGQLNQQETLPLFPLHPTGILLERSSITSNSSLSSSLTTSAENSTTTPPTPSSSCDTNEQDHTFFDFF
ncbi:hypothetical protein LguiA_012114 [Lonicera macranthoides]